MCGIAGYAGTDALDPARIDACLKLMGRRGPDHAAWKSWAGPAGRKTYLLHSRLSIIDLDARAHQPFLEDKKALVFNGELYNFLEIRKDLEARGKRFATSSDTEVLIKALAADGWDVLDKLEGMWAFALYDEADGTLTLCRDRFGEKPLFYYRDGSGVYFGSEVKYIAALLGRRLELNHSHLYRFLVNGYKALYKEKNSFFRGMEEVPAAGALRLGPGAAEKAWTYWTPRFAPDEGMTFAQAAAGARERLIRSVELRLRADVPLAFCMSGGIDSNALISVAKKVFNYDVHGFTIANTDERYEESEMVDHAVGQLKLRHTSLPVDTRDFLPRLRRLVRQHDAPVYTITYYAQWLLMQSVAEHGYKISVSGTAADELFTGYYDHHLAYLYEVRNDAALHAASKAAWMTHIKPIVRNPHLGNPDLFIKDPAFRDHIFLDAPAFAEYLVKPWFEPFHERRFTDSLLRNRTMNELFHEAIPVILHEDDLNAMYFSVENRSPFLDRSLFEFCHTIPTRHLIREARAKAVLRESMRGIVPDKILDNPRKVGFNAPIYSFLDVNDPSVRAELLADSPVFDHIRRDKIEELIQKARLPNSESKFLFYFLSTKMFLEEFGG